MDGRQTLNTLVALALAFLLGGLIGLERQFRQRNAGLRTNVLVATGAAAFVDLGLRMAGEESAVRVVSYVVSGIGFLGAGVIMKEGMQVRGLNTAATLWASAAVGACAGGGQWAEAAMVAAFVLAGNTLLRPLAEAVNRLPIRGGQTEAHYRLHVVCRPLDVTEVRDLIDAECERHHYPVREIEVLTETEDTLELAASLAPSSADEGELDAIVTHLEHSDAVESATWSASTEV
jgi:putative Mg2+ transporter-C (MgtC) family protein